MMSKPLFSEFSPVSAKAFKQKIQYDLDGAEYNETLVWNSAEGISVKPFYHREETQALPIPGQPKTWSIAEEIFILKAETAATTAKKALDKGAEALFFKAENKFDIAQLLEQLPQQELVLYFNFSFLDSAFNEALLQQTASKGFQCHLNLDILGNLACSGNWYTSQKEDHKALEQLFLNPQNDNVIGVDLTLYHNAGAHSIQELAYALAHVNEYFNHYGALLGNQQITFKVALGGNYFFEIAKLRALRLLFARLADEYNLNTQCHILAIPGLRNKTLYDYNTNLLRTTTEAMSGILGTADTICNTAYDAIYHKTNEFGQRIARNQLLILKNESYFDQIENPADGTYYIENLTKQFAEKALALFKEIEAGGGLVTQLIEGKIQKKIKDSAAKEQKAFDEQQKVLVGTNAFINSEDKMKSELELYPFVKMNPRKTLIEPIIPKRLAEQMEQKRLKDE
tara:strand:- start:13900 stop:15264 length:1365 start_codon:yes stop_codon:yes gene_type:complete